MIKSFVRKNVVKTMYFAYLHSSLKYSILFWENPKNQKKNVKLQKRAARLIANITSTTHQKIKDLTVPNVCVHVCVCFL
jgi:hypothetical protein